MEIGKVMLVDDDASIRRIGQISLEDVGKFQVVIAKSGTEALELAASEKPDLIVLDVMMPGMDGPTTLTHLRENPITKCIPIIFMTAKVLLHEVDAYYQLGAAGVISKPFDPMLLASQIRQLVSARAA